MIIDLENLNGKNTEKNSFINMEISRIKDYMKEKVKIKVNKNKKIVDIHDFLTKNIKHCDLFKNINQNLRLIKNIQVLRGQLNLSFQQSISLKEQ